MVIFLTAGVILLTLALADLTLPRLAPAKASEEDERAVYAASIKVLELTIAELEDRIASKKHPELESATRDVISRYRIRLTRERLALEGSGPILWDLIRGMLTAQQKRADEIQASGMEGISIDDIGPFMEALRSIRSSVGYYDRGERIGMRGFGLRGKLAMIRPRLQFRAASPERRQRIYYECCLFELELEKVALAYLADQVESGDASRAAVAQTLAREHEAAQISLGRRLRYHEKMMSSGNATLAKTHLDELLDNIEQYGAMIDAGALGVELEQVNKLYQRGEISSGVASDLRERVYLLQMELSE